MESEYKSAILSYNSVKKYELKQLRKRGRIYRYVQRLITAIKKTNIKSKERIIRLKKPDIKLPKIMQEKNLLIKTKKVKKTTPKKSIISVQKNAWKSLKTSR